MSEMSGNGKENEATPATNADDSKKKPDLDDTISRLLRTQADVDAETEEGEESSD